MVDPRATILFDSPISSQQEEEDSTSTNDPKQQAPAVEICGYWLVGFIVLVFTNANCGRNENRHDGVGNVKCNRKPLLLIDIGTSLSCGFKLVASPLERSRHFPFEM